MSSTRRMPANPPEQPRADSDVRLSRGTSQLRIRARSFSGSHTSHWRLLSFAGQARRNRCDSSDLTPVGSPALLELISGALQTSFRARLAERFARFRFRRRRARNVSRSFSEKPAIVSFARLGICVEGRHAYGRTLRFESDSDVTVAKTRARAVDAAHVRDGWIDKVRWRKAACDPGSRASSATVASVYGRTHAPLRFWRASDLLESLRVSLPKIATLWSLRTS